MPFTKKLLQPPRIVMPPPGPVYVCFREPGADPEVGGYQRADTDEEKLELTAYYKDLGMKVTWTDDKGTVL